MSTGLSGCPDWRTLVDRRDREPRAWDAALEHLDGCPRCRDEALVHEPTLLFRRLPGPELRRGEIAAMKEAVAALRRNDRRPPRSGWMRSGWMRAAAAAAILIAAGLLEGTVRPDRPGASLAAAGAPAPGASLAALSSERLPQLEQMPLVEYADPIYGSVVEVVDDEISLVLVLPPADGV